LANTTDRAVSLRVKVNESVSAQCLRRPDIFAG
jgi:hypothetical protein